MSKIVGYRSVNIMSIGGDRRGGVWSDGGLGGLSYLFKELGGCWGGVEGGKRVLRVGGSIGDVVGTFWRGGGRSEGTFGPGEGSKGQH